MVASGIPAIMCAVLLSFKPTVPTASDSMQWQVLKRLHAMALKTAGLEDTGSRLRSIRARRSAWIPSLRLKYGAESDETHRANIDRIFTDTVESTDSTSWRTQRNKFELELKWKLADSVYHPQDLRMTLQERRRKEAVSELKRKVTHAYIYWLSAQRAFATAQSISAHEDAKRQLLQWSLTLNTLVGGDVTKIPVRQ